ncbi:MAG: (d)CMP kinase [Actinomycetes bacterium]
MSTPLIVAIDGPSGSGKSSVSKGVARSLGLNYLDTGSMYRALTWLVQNRGVDVNDSDAIIALISQADVVPSTDPANPGITVDGIDVSEPIRGDNVTRGVSIVSAVPEVRHQMVDLQRAIAAGSQHGIVVEGRDIGGVVLPHANVKIFLTADAQARALRRAAESGASVDATKEQLLNRDQADSTRVASPLEIADGAIEVDTTHMSLDEVISHIVSLASNNV